MPLARQVITIEYKLALAVAPMWLSTKSQARLLWKHMDKRRNWLFADTTKGAKASAALYSIVSTARANGLEPYAYLKRLFTALPNAKTVEDFEALLPFNTAPPS